MRISTSIRKRLTRVLNELTEIKLDLAQPEATVSDKDVDFILDEAERIGNAAPSTRSCRVGGPGPRRAVGTTGHRIASKVVDMTSGGKTQPFVRGG